MKRKKVTETNVINSEVTAIDRTEEKKYFSSIHENANLFNNEVTIKTITTDMTKLQQIDVMQTSRIAIFRKAIKLNMSYERLVRFDVQFYHKTNDRSKTRRQDKHNNLYDYCYNNRTSKQLRDVLKEVAIVEYLNKKYNLNNKQFTVSEYKKLVK